MKSISQWLAVVIIGLVVVLAGIIILYSGLEAKLELRDSLDDVATESIYYFEMEASGGKAIEVQYNLSAGNMTVAILTETGFVNLSNNGSFAAEEMYDKAMNTSIGDINWTPEASGTYYIVFYGFSVDESSLEIEVSYFGMDTPRFLGGLIVIIIGILIAILGMILRRKRSISEIKKPEEDIGSEPAPEDQAEELSELKEPPEV